MTLLWASIILMLIIACGIIFQRPFQKKNICLIIVFSFIALTLYWHWGNSQQWQRYLQTQQLPRHLPTADKMIDALKNHLATDPNSAQGWYLLGRLYASQKNYVDAANAFAKANMLQPQQVNTMLNYAEALFMQQNPKYFLTIANILKQILVLNPNNNEALNLLALNYYQQHQYQKAIAIWEKLSERYPPNTPDGQAILNAIAKAQQEREIKNKWSS